MKRVLHIVLLFSVLFSMLLGILPDSLLDYTHSHAHERQAEHHDGTVITVKHYDCELPDFYFEHYLPDTQESIQYTEPVACDTPFTTDSHFPATEVYFSLRAPPYDAHS